ncbi:hypothetical protein [Leptospirillum ferriphilum]|uniref:hypothetical protein n=1 Tax=Leptospirillum ferriphilum TaxID=178606 RepID=UPI0006B1F063|nr:hypothetical protein [Leptospirillum ferriphilum]
MTSSNLLQKLRILFKRNASPPMERKNQPWARIQKQKGQTLLSWGMGDGRTFGVLMIHPGDSFSLEEDGFHHRSGTGEHVFGISGEEENLLLGAAIEGTLRKKEIFFGKTILGTGMIVGFIGLLLLIGTSMGPDLRHLASLSQSSPNGLEGVNSPSLPDTFPGMGGLTCNVGH